MGPGERQIGQLLGGTYRIERKLASGGMGVVYEASHARLPTRFAVKFLLTPARGSDSELVLERFKREAQVAATLKNPHVVQIHDYQVDDDGFPYIVMELLRGEDLAHRIEREGALPPTQALRILEQLASALDVAHWAGIIHRDLKPANVFLAKDPEADHVKVLDFGVSRMRSLETITRADALLGTPLYMSPEQAGAGGEVTAASDIFAFGVIAYEVLTGRRPFGGSSVPAVLYQVVNNAPARVSASLGPNGRDVDAVFAQLLAKEPALRYASAGEAVRALRVALAPLLSSEELPESVDSLSDQATIVRLAPALEPDPREPPPTGSLPAEATRVARHRVANTAADARGEVLQRTPRSKSSRRQLWLGAATVVLVSTAATVGYDRLHRPVRDAPATVERTTAAATPLPAEVHVAIKVSPPTAEVTLDDRPVLDGAITVPWRAVPRELRIQAPGYEPIVQEVDASRDREIEIALVPTPPRVAATDAPIAKVTPEPIRRARSGSARPPTTPPARAAPNRASKQVREAVEGLVEDLE